MADLIRICPFCREAGKKSTLAPGLTSSTCMAGPRGYFDEDGNFVKPRDPNTHRTLYTCSGGHDFVQIQREGEPDKIELVSAYRFTSPSPQDANG